MVKMGLSMTDMPIIKITKDVKLQEKYRKLPIISGAPTIGI